MTYEFFQHRFVAIVPPDSVRDFDVAFLILYPDCLGNLANYLIG